MRIWRISNFADLSGRGGSLVGGRWHRQGTPIVYCTDHPSTALLEILVHVTRETIPDHFQLIEIQVPEDIKADAPAIKDDWQADIAYTRRIGMAFLSASRGVLLKVPSAIMPKASSYLLNPRHPDASRIEIVGSYHYPFDSRLFQ
jgi:RES domain-containing protein